jgi:hypothetical protein
MPGLAQFSAYFVSNIWLIAYGWPMDFFLMEKWKAVLYSRVDTALHWLSYKHWIDCPGLADGPLTYDGNYTSGYAELGWPSSLLTFFQTSDQSPKAGPRLSQLWRNERQFYMPGLAQCQKWLCSKNQVDCPGLAHGSLAYGGKQLVDPSYWVGPVLCWLCFKPGLISQGCPMALWLT